MRMSLHTMHIADTRMQPETIPPFRIAHLSDPHISRRYYREYIRSLKLLLRAILDEGFDHIVVTGDITSTADPDDFALAREIFATFGLLHADRLTVVPGNHDVFGGPHRAVDVLDFPRMLRCADLARARATFIDAFAETFDGAHRTASFFPLIKHVGPCDIVCLDTTMPWSLMRNPFGSNGAIDSGTRTALARLAPMLGRGGRIPIVAMHHHLHRARDAQAESALWNTIEGWTMRLHGSSRLLRTFRSLGVRAVLHGHVHQSRHYEHAGMQIANGAGAVCDDPHPYLKYNTLHLADGAPTMHTTVLPIPYQKPSLPAIAVRTHERRERRLVTGIPVEVA